ncbi:hypothetical protein CEUSTIGMA_g1132.t1 [Chlamydomonas eustigma]|uniref:Gag1-like clamp domain-containing protein n=1 Tax=Chlamydomonas eustigma TaxID=1157962 RepID=A0A250WSC3_9CHLO|nr:hypothetical protein CEUSTIGMA_g1132.t1 [Chlamydomonas eustigma]|eukprot:GAX73681.1 hypothetical protein CEUSTIGMA_g1132.t1 [Chlamydomonas eustigma]
MSPSQKFSSCLKISGFWHNIFWSSVDCVATTFAMNKTEEEAETSISALSKDADGDLSANKDSSLNWEEFRKRWHEEGGPAKKIRRTQYTVVTFEMLSTSAPFPHPVPLSEVVECLVEAWENEQDYD